MNRPKEWPLAGILGFERFTSTRFPSSDQLPSLCQRVRIGFRKMGWSPLGIAPVQRQARLAGENVTRPGIYVGGPGGVHIQRRHGHIDICGLSGEYFAPKMWQISSEKFGNRYG